MSKKFLKFQPQGWIHQGGGKFGWSENYNEHPIDNYNHSFNICHVISDHTLRLFLDIL